MSKAIDHTGIRYGKAVGVRPTNERKGKQIIWEWRCDCGVIFASVAGNFVHRDILRVAGLVFQQKKLKPYQL